jgi:methionine transaminase
VHVPLDPETFAVDWDAVQAAFTPRTRMLMINSPHNPSGAMLAPEDMARLGRHPARHDAFLLSDEVYEHIVFDGRGTSRAALPGVARARVRGVQLRQDLPLHRLEGRLLHRAAG